MLTAGEVSGLVVPVTLALAITLGMAALRVKSFSTSVINQPFDKAGSTSTVYAREPVELGRTVPANPKVTLPGVEANVKLALPVPENEPLTAKPPKNLSPASTQLPDVNRNAAVTLPPLVTVSVMPEHKTGAAWA